MTREETNPTMPKLKKLALRLLDSNQPTEKLKQRDVTDLYYDDKDVNIKQDKLINVQINGSPGEGKSTVMVAEVIDTNVRLKKKTTIHHILPNQIVYGQVMRNLSKQMRECIGVDEYDVLGDTGYNSSTDKAQLNHFSDLHREDYVHIFACSPQDLMDKNANIILEVFQADKKEQYTRCLVYYRVFEAGMEHTQLVGYIDVDVSHVLEMDLYKEYYKRKKHRLRLFNTYGLKSEREIFFAEVILDAFIELKDIAKHRKIDAGMAELQIDMSTRKMRQMSSILKTQKDTSDLLMLLKYVTEAERCKQDALKATNENKEELAKEYLRMHTQFKEKLNIVLDYWAKASSLKEMYVSKFGDTNGKK